MEALMVTVVVPSVWTVDRRSLFQVEEGPLFEVLRRLAAQHPQCRDRVIGPDGEPLMFVNVSVDDRLVPRQDRATTVVPAGSTVILIAPIAGG
jgi:hypothetical protein